mgnify:CR=1 FL=1
MGDESHDIVNGLVCQRCRVPFEDKRVLGRPRLCRRCWKIAMGYDHGDLDDEDEDG